MANHRQALNEHWRHLSGFPNVLNAAAGTKVKDGQDTKVPAIVVYVSKKVKEAELGTSDIIPKEVDGVPTDVVEFAPTTWTAGKTTISELHPEEQRKRLGAIVPKQKLEKRKSKKVSAAQPSGKSDWTAYAQPTQDQGGCGSCMSFDITGVWEALLKIATGEVVKLSESHLFFCGGGRCSFGSMPEVVLNQAMKGVCLESCLPYSQNVYDGNDEYCQQGICSNWWRDAKKLAGWTALSGPTEIQVALDAGPLVATFDVPQSFLNYTGGVYTRLQNDPIIGGHGIGIFGYYLACFQILRNSWGTGWGQNCVINDVPRPGWCMIDPTLLDSVMYQLRLDGTVTPPSGCDFLRKLSKYFSRNKASLAAIVKRGH